MGDWTFTVPTGIAAWERPVEGARGRFTPKKVLESERAIGIYALAAGVRRMGKARIGVHVLIAIGTRGDVDNRAKTVLDGLEKAGIVDNDEQVDDLACRRVLPPGSPPVVRVFELADPPSGTASREVARPGPRRRSAQQRRPGSSPKTESPSRVLPGS